MTINARNQESSNRLPNTMPRYASAFNVKFSHTSS